MAGISSTSTKGARRSVDQEINMVPFIDLLMVTISFLLITAVWNALGGLNASAHAPSEKGHAEAKAPETALQIHVRAGVAKLEGQTGNKIDDIASVPLEQERLVALEGAVAKAFAAGLAEGRIARPIDGKQTLPTPAVLHVPSALPMGDIARVLDAVGSVQSDKMPAFAVTFSST